MIRRLVFAFALLLPSFAYSQFNVPSQTIEGGGETQPGEVVILKLSSLGAVKGLVSTSVEWSIFEADIDAKTKSVKGYVKKKFTVDAKGNVVFGAGIRPKKILAVASVNYVFEEKEGEKLIKFVSKTAILHDVVSVVGDECEPKPPSPVPPPPDIDPKPQPDENIDNKFGLSKFVLEAASTVSASGKLKALALAASFKSVASRIGAGAYSDYKEIFIALEQSNNRALGDQIDAWKKWGATLEDKLFALANGNKTWTNEDFRQAFLEIYDGLLKVK